MKSEYVYTALIDVLSYRNRLQEDINSGQESFKDDLIQSLSIFDNINTAIFGVQAISDTIIITCNRHDRFFEFLEILKSVFIAFMSKGLLIRGGVAYSKHFQSGRITYSHAVARSYEIESKIAVYPRIVIDKNILDMYETANHLPSIFNKNILIKQNDITFLNIIDDKNWNDLYQMARDIYEKNKSILSGNELAFLKHLWFEGYLFSSGATPGTQKYIPSFVSL